jgi:hypothetical protein
VVWTRRTSSHEITIRFSSLLVGNDPTRVTPTGALQRTRHIASARLLAVERGTTIRRAVYPTIESGLNRIGGSHMRFSKPTAPNPPCSPKKPTSGPCSLGYVQGCGGLELLDDRKCFRSTFRELFANLFAYRRPYLPKGFITPGIFFRIWVRFQPPRSVPPQSHSAKNQADWIIPAN